MRLRLAATIAALALAVAACGGDGRPDGPASRTADTDAGIDTVHAVPDPAALAERAAGADTTGRSDRLIVPGVRVGPVTLASPEADLLAALPAGQLVRREIYLAEGFCTDGSALFPGTPDEVEIGWADSTRSRPAFLRVRGNGSRWATPAGVRIGTTLKELEAIRGETLTFSGFGWDYGGGLGWLEPDDAHSAGIQLAYTDSSAESYGDDPAWREISGERSVRSDHPLVRRLTIRVESITIGTGATRDEHECREMR